MKKLIEDNYSSIVKRGLISPTTKKRDFMNKLNEEVNELIYEFINKDVIDAEELADVILVCLNIAKHYNIDIEKEMRGKIAVNFNRAKNGK